MKKNSLVLLLFLFLLPGKYLYAQEEFFVNQDGFSFSYLRGFKTPVQADAFGFSFYNKKGFIVGMGIERAGDINAPMATLLLCPGWTDNPNGFKPIIGPSYSYINGHHVIGINVGMNKGFFVEKKFPFSVNGAFSFQTALSKSSLESKLFPVLGYGYTQAFFARSRLYPFINISNAYSLNSEDHLLSVAIGINVKLGSNVDKNEN